MGFTRSLKKTTSTVLQKLHDINNSGDFHAGPGLLQGHCSPTKLLLGETLDNELLYGYGVMSFFLILAPIVIEASRAKPLVYVCNLSPRY